MSGYSFVMNKEFNMFVKDKRNLKCLVAIGVLLASLTGCTLAPQKLMVDPVFSFGNLNFIKGAVELNVTDNRKDKEVLGYRDANKNGQITFSNSLVAAIGESVKKSLVALGVDVNGVSMAVDTNQIALEIIQLKYSSPDKNWVGHINLEAEILVKIKHSSAVMTKRFRSNRALDVATAPGEEFNEKLLNALLSDLINTVFTDREIISFLK